MNPVDTLDSGKCARISPPGEKEKPGLGVFSAFLLSFNLKKEAAWLMDMWLKLAYGSTLFMAPHGGYTCRPKLEVKSGALVAV